MDSNDFGFLCLMGLVLMVLFFGTPLVVQLVNFTMQAWGHILM